MYVKKLTCRVARLKRKGIHEQVHVHDISFTTFWVCQLLRREAVSVNESSIDSV